MNILNLLSGYTKYKVEANGKENTINLLKSNCSVRNIRINGDYLLFAVFYRETKKVDELLEKNNVKPIAKKSYGLSYLLGKYKHRAGLLTGAALIALTVFLSTFFVWEIRVEGNEKVRDGEIIELLDSVGFREGVLKKSVRTESVINKCLIKDDRISWMSINYEGTVAHVELKEARIVKRIENKENVNLVASFNGIVHRVDALSGSAVVSNGDSVTKGQILVSAFVDKRTGGNSLRGAKGFVWAYTERCYRVCVPMKYREKEYTDEKQINYAFSFLGKGVFLNHKKARFDVFDCETNSDRFRLTNKAALPIMVKKTEFSEYCCTEKRRNEERALELAKKTAEQRLKSDTNNFTLISCDDRYSIENDVLVYDCTFYGNEDIARELEFDVKV